jgi:seryl-tRNA synthetase
MQGVVPWDVIFKINNDYGLSGSAEQGILECFTGKNINDTLKVYAKNQCFRFEKEFNGLKYLKEFIKLEQFVFCRKAQKDYYFEQLLNNSVEFLKYHNIKHRIVDVTQRDKGYHIKKYDIEVYTMTYDWMETHSCSYFGTNQTKRFGISGVTHTISNTGIASPRILIPFLEREL